MAICAQCNVKETQLYESGTPICLDCCSARTIKRKPVASEHKIRAILLQEVFRATALCEEAVKEFDTAADQSNLQPSDGGERIVSAARKLTIARNEVLMARNRLNNCLDQEDVSEDLGRRAIA